MEVKILILVILVIDVLSFLTILKTEDEFWSLDEDRPSANEVRDVPANFKEWVGENSDRIEKASERGTLPYFIRDNKGVVDAVMKDSDKRENIGKDLSIRESQNIIKNPLSEEIRKRREKIREEARNKIVGIPIHIPALDMEASISNKGVKEWLNQPHSHIAEKNELILNIQNVLENALYVGYGVDKHDSDAFVHLFEIEILGDKSWIILRRLFNNELKIHSISDSHDIVSKMIGNEKSRN